MDLLQKMEMFIGEKDYRDEKGDVPGEQDTGPKKKADSTEEEYRKFFEKKMKEWGIDSPDELSDKEKKKFFKEVEDEWTYEDEATDDGDE